jgi:hypothetical protein
MSQRFGSIGRAYGASLAKDAGVTPHLIPQGILMQANVLKRSSNCTFALTNPVTLQSLLPKTPFIDFNGNSG